MTPNLRKVYADPAATAAQLATAVTDARKLAGDLQAEVVQFDADRLDLAADDAARARARTKLAEARDKLELAERLVAELDARRVAAEAAEDAQERLARHHAAQKQADEAVRSFLKEYEAGCLMVLGAYRKLLEAQIVVAASNAESAEQIEDPEQTARSDADARYTPYALLATTLHLPQIKPLELPFFQPHLLVYDGNVPMVSIAHATLQQVQASLDRAASPKSGKIIRNVKDAA